jgi:hypothetical protein
MKSSKPWQTPCARSVELHHMRNALLVASWALRARSRSPHLAPAKPTG